MKNRERFLNGEWFSWKNTTNAFYHYRQTNKAKKWRTPVPAELYFSTCHMPEARIMVMDEETFICRIYKSTFAGQRSFDFEVRFKDLRFEKKK